MNKEALHMSKKLDDLDLDEDLYDGPPAQEEATDTPAVAPDTPKDPEEEEWEACLQRLTKCQSKTWICVPAVTRTIHSEEPRLTVKIQELENCNPTTFFEWICYVYPYAKTMQHTPEDYDKYKDRMAAWTAVLSHLKQLKFPASGLSRADKASTKDSVKVKKE
jgi:hypothetical protein